MSPHDDGDDDDAWMTALSGRPAPGAPASTRAEGRRLGEALRRWPAKPAQADLSPPGDEALMEAARAAGLLGKPPCRLCAAMRSWLQAPLRPALAGALGLALVLVLLPRPPQPVEADAPPVLRGAGAVQSLTDVAPLARRDRIARQLEAAGVKVLRYERFGRAGLSAQITPAQRQDLTPMLKAEGLSPGVEGELHVEVQAP